MKDPYHVLGVQREVENDVIKRTYRQLSRKYHPDANIHNPNKELAEERFKEIQEAYKQIMKEREQEEEIRAAFKRKEYKEEEKRDKETSLFNSAAAYIQNSFFKEALDILAQITNKNAMWYYYHGTANLGLNRHIMAVDDAENALRLEPENTLYQQFYNNLRSAEHWYQSQAEKYDLSKISIGDCCCKIMIFNCICGCCI